MFTDRLKECRESQGLSQVELADKIGISKDLYNKYERTVTRPSFETLCNIATALNVSTDYLLGLSEYKNINEQALVKSSTLDSAFENLSFSSRENIVQVTKDLITCIKDFEKYHSSKYIDRDAGAGGYLFSTIGNYIKAYQAAADYLNGNKSVSAIVYKLDEMLSGADQSMKFIWEIARDMEPTETEGGYLDNIIYLRHALQSVSAGTGTYLTDECMENIRVKFNKQTACADFCVTVSGESMEPKFHDGDVLLVHEQPDIEQGEFGVFVINDEGYVKQRGDKELISLNPNYENIPFHPDDDILCGGKVIGVLSQDEILI